MARDATMMFVAQADASGVKGLFGDRTPLRDSGISIDRAAGCGYRRR